MASQQPFAVSCSQDNRDIPSTGISASTAPVPAGKRFVVEHISGYLVVLKNFPVDLIVATNGFEQTLYLPTHFESQVLNFGGELGPANQHQFGSPVTMYVEAGQSITVHGAANVAGFITATAIRHLVNQ